MWMHSVFLDIALPTSPMSATTAVNGAMALAVALAAGTAALVIRGWGGDGRRATLGGLIYGFAPFLSSMALGYLQPWLAVIPPLVFLVLSEVLVKRRRWAPLLAIGAGIVLALPMAQAMPVLVTAGTALALGAVTVAGFRPAGSPIALSLVLQSLVCGVIAYVGALAYPLSIHTNSRTLTATVGDNGSDVRRAADTLLVPLQAKLLGGGLLMYGIGALVAAGAVECFRRAKLRWSLLPIGGVAVLAILALHPQLSLH